MSLSRSGSEKSCKKELLSETKKLKSAIGLSMNQNLRNMTSQNSVIHNETTTHKSGYTISI